MPRVRTTVDIDVVVRHLNMACRSPTITGDQRFGMMRLATWLVESSGQKLYLTTPERPDLHRHFYSLNPAPMVSEPGPEAVAVEPELPAPVRESATPSQPSRFKGGAAKA